MLVLTGFVIADFDSLRNNGKANQQNQLNSYDIRVCSIEVFCIFVICCSEAF